MCHGRFTLMQTAAARQTSAQEVPQIKVATPWLRTLILPVAQNAAITSTRGAGLSSHWENCSKPPTSYSIWWRLRWPSNSQELSAKGNPQRGITATQRFLREKISWPHWSSLSHKSKSPWSCRDAPFTTSIGQLPGKSLPWEKNILMWNITHSSLCWGVGK